MRGKCGAETLKADGFNHARIFRKIAWTNASSGWD
jgi:hypothetical protein